MFIFYYTRVRPQCDVSILGADRYGVASISRLLKIIGLFCRISSFLYVSFAKETCDFKEPTSRSHRIDDEEKAVAYGEVGGWGRDPKKMYGERLGDGVENHLMSPTPRR